MIASISNEDVFILLKVENISFMKIIRLEKSHIT